MLKNKKIVAGLIVLFVILIIVPVLFLKQFLIKRQINKIIDSSIEFVENNKIEKILSFVSNKYFDKRGISKTDLEKKILENKQYFKNAKITLLKKDFVKVESERTELKLKVLIRFEAVQLGKLDGLESLKIVFIKEYSDSGDNQKKWVALEINEIEKY
ncbi:hypothetical protein KA977_15535 [Candidatus Dependentiae bacterium]|nr:hypothetical protein [Candidatus Dependentiae bacterium]